ncbi:hypothetical protein OSI28_15180, partial [Mycobacterium ulcerans]
PQPGAAAHAAAATATTGYPALRDVNAAAHATGAAAAAIAVELAAVPAGTARPTRSTRQGEVVAAALPAVAAGKGGVLFGTDGATG